MYTENLTPAVNSFISIQGSQLEVLLKGQAWICVDLINNISMSRSRKLLSIVYEVVSIQEPEFTSL